MSTPRFLHLPPGVQPCRVPTARGELAGLRADPDGQPSAFPVLMVPGFTGSKEDFTAVLALIAGAGRVAVAIDQLGQFESAGDDDPTSYDVKAHAEDVLAVAAHLGARPHLVGHSFGGLVARAAALADPGALRSLTLLSSGPAALPHPSASNLQLICAALPGMDLESIWAAKRQMELPTETEEFLHRRFVANSPVALRRHAEQLLSAPDEVEALARLDLPVLVAYGAMDDAWPPAVQADMAARLGARVEVLSEAGHSPAWEAPEATVGVLETFWAGAERSGS